MKKKLTLWILLLPCLVFAQVEVKDGALTIDFGKKKQVTQDSTQTDSTVKEQKPVKVKKQKQATDNVPEQEEDPDYNKEGLFKALFIAGMNLSQIDGDEQAGYVHPGAHVGIGTLVKFHKNLSVSAEILYSMKGANKRLNANESPQYMFRQNWDYIQVPLLFNVHDKKLVMASVGLSLNYLVRNKLVYNVYDNTGSLDSSKTYQLGQKLGVEPKKFDLGGVVAFQFLIKKVFGIGARFEYSLIGLKPATNPNKIKQMHNNSITLRFMYILDPVALKKKR